MIYRAKPDAPKRYMLRWEGSLSALEDKAVKLTYAQERGSVPQNCQATKVVLSKAFATVALIGT